MNDYKNTIDDLLKSRDQSVSPRADFLSQDQKEDNHTIVKVLQRNEYLLTNLKECHHHVVM